jgi:site-specific DNA-cytosine methylase
MQAKFRCLGGIDSDPAAIEDFGRLAGVPGTVMDLFDREQYALWHGHEPPADWREASLVDLRRAAGNERPHIVFTSPPCKGFSGLLSQKLSETQKYQALNKLTLRGVWLMLEAWSSDPPEFVVFENVPRIMHRGRHLLDQITSMLQQYGYATAETTHDCGELGGLAQSRRRFLMVARHQEKVPPFLYEPQTKPLITVGDVLGRLPLPGNIEMAGPMHRVPSLQWRTWVRLALVTAGSDWRSLERLKIKDGVLADYGIVPEVTYQGGVFGVRRWDESTGTVTGRGGPSNGAFSVADPRFAQSDRWNDGQQYGVCRWQEATGTVTGQQSPGQGRFSVADPRLNWHPSASRNKYRVIQWDRQAGTVIGAQGPADGAGCVADPRLNGTRHYNIFRVIRYDAPSPTVTAGMGPTAGGLAIADPRTGWKQRPNYQTAGQYGVVPWTAQAYSVPGHAKHDGGPWSVADPRICHSCSIDTLPAASDRGTYQIWAMDNTWHRPFTTLELAALQGLVDPEEYLLLHGSSHKDWRERIGNAVPPPAAKAVAGVIGRALLLAWSGETFVLDAMPVWVRPLAVALSVKSQELIG